MPQTPNYDHRYEIDPILILLQCDKHNYIDWSKTLFGKYLLYVKFTFINLMQILDYLFDIIKYLTIIYNYL